jgi:amino acid permease
LAPVGVDSTAEESGTLAAQEAKASEKTTPRVFKNMIYRFIENFRVCKINLILIKY